MPDEKQLREKQIKDRARLDVAFSEPSDESPKSKKSPVVDADSESKSEDAADDVKKSAKKNTKKPDKASRSTIVMTICGVLGLIGGGVMITLPFVLPKEALPDLVFPQIPSKVEDDAQKVYSDLTGQELTNESLKTAPAFCVQTPNGNDGARPHSGLGDAGVVFEAIAEAGITRFAAIYQNPTQAVIGPIRSLRLYYLQWDTPFDCVIVHAGGAPDALAAVSHGYKDLTENYTYMYRGTYGVRRWNNLFTTSAYLKKAAEDRGWETSNIKGFARMTPEDSSKSRVDSTVKTKLDILKPTTENTSKMEPAASHIKFDMGGSDTFDVVYDYDVATNSYKRSYGTGEAHNVYRCPTDDLGEKNPEDACELTQMAPSVVIGIVVSEHRASDNYHEDITTTGSGDAYIFQNGVAVKGTWHKNTKDDQITFTDASGKEVLLAPGQTFITAVPNYGSITY